MTGLRTKLTYPRNDKYEYYVKLARIDLDRECYKDLTNNKGFIIEEPQKVTKDLKSEKSIYSSKFGRSLQDKDPYSNRYSCKYGCTQGAFYAVPDDANWVCPICKTEVKLVGDDLTYFGWIKIYKGDLIHPVLYPSLVSLIGKDNLENIIEPKVMLDANGMPMSEFDKKLLKKKTTRKYKKKSLDETFGSIGMLEFKKRFFEIIEYFYKKKPNKKAVYDDIMNNKDIIFFHSIPVYSTKLRPFKVENKRFTFESTNGIFNILAKDAATLNKNDISIYRNTNSINQLLWHMQMSLNELSEEIIKILSGKKGIIRTTISGRTAFSERSVIVPNPKLRVDEITLPYFGLCHLLQQVLVNIIQKSYNITYAEAFKIWYYASLKIDKKVEDIIWNLIKANKIRVLINRNPSIFYQSIVYKKVVGLTHDFSMGIDDYSIKGLEGDFDGDTINILLLFNKQFADACEEVYSPRNAFCISRNDGRMNNLMNIYKDTVININGIMDLGREFYTEEQINHILEAKKLYK